MCELSAGGMTFNSGLKEEKQEATTRAVTSLSEFGLVLEK